MRELDKFIAASDERIEKKQNFHMQQSDAEREETNKKSAEASMARSLAASIETELIAILKPRYRGAEAGDRGRIYFDIEGKTFYIICDPFLKDGEVLAGWFGVIRHGANEQLAMLQFRSESFQDDLLQGIRHTR
ncbi:MAG TPA: hypothetical protein VKZ53_24270 [Candidatus Angelobacter sp.]|nr:hypothetical protein [Candidatus Angelobacter sp.]